MVIYLHEKCTYSTVALYERSDVWGGQFIQISGNELSYKLLLGNVYRPPRDILEDYNTFNDEFSHVLEQLYIFSKVNMDLEKKHSTELACLELTDKLYR